MTHVQIKFGPDAAEVLVDGVDIGPHVLAEGFGVTFSDLPEQPSKVHLILAADSIDVELPGAVVDVVRRPRLMCEGEA